MAASGTNVVVLHVDLEARSNEKLEPGGIAGQSVLLVEWPLMAGEVGVAAERGLLRGGGFGG